MYYIKEQVLQFTPRRFYDLYLCIVEKVLSFTNTESIILVFFTTRRRKNRRFHPKVILTHTEKIRRRL